MNAQLLTALRATGDQYISGSDIAQRLGVNRSTVWKHIERLRHHGYEIEAVPHLGYRLRVAPDALHDFAIGSGLQTRYFGQELRVFDLLDSTMDTAHQWAADDAPEGALVCAEQQRAGRGRLGRTWASPVGGGLYASVILRPQLPLRDMSALTLTMAIGIARGLEQAVGLRAEIKWPNDLYVGAQKIGGILTELRADQHQLQHIVVGFGVNVNTQPALLPDHATTVAQEVGHPVDRVDLLQQILYTLEQVYDQLTHEGFAALQTEWKSRSRLLGRHVRVVSQAHADTTSDQVIEGRVIDIDNEGALVLRHDNGVQERLTAGDVITLW
jgi:BirA family transcriptional regulator, biotin operon repressor / biotin---[acetyl-CoA-carboxylase] ligase